MPIGVFERQGDRSMAKFAMKGMIAGCVLLWAAAMPAWAQPSVAQILNFKPIHEVQISTPTPEEYGSCKVELVKGTKAGTSGWLLVDAKKRPLRRFFDNKGDNKIHIWSYFRDGEE